MTFADTKHVPWTLKYAKNAFAAGAQYLSISVKRNLNVEANAFVSKYTVCYRAVSIISYVIISFTIYLRLPGRTSHRL